MLFRSADTKEQKPQDLSAVATQLLKARNDSNQPRSFVSACIFKVGDDTRQDALALQVIQFCKDIWLNTGLELFVVSRICTVPVE